MHPSLTATVKASSLVKPFYSGGLCLSSTTCNTPMILAVVCPCKSAPCNCFLCRYDLKGSTHTRTAGAANPQDPKSVFKDLDLDIKLLLPKDTYER